MAGRKGLPPQVKDFINDSFIGDISESVFEYLRKDSHIIKRLQKTYCKRIGETKKEYDEKAAKIREYFK